jgi:hypothetical protein
VQVRTYLTRNFARSLSPCFQGSRTLSWSIPVHDRGDASNLFDALRIEMPVRFHQQQDASELQELDVLAGLERVLHEEGSDDLGEAATIANAIRQPVTVVLAHDTAAEVRLEGVQDLGVALVLHNGELGEDLYPRGHLVVLADSDVETALAVDEPGDPLRFQLH